MSWDVLILNLPPEITDIDQVHDSLVPLGSADEVLFLLKSLFPPVDFSNPNRGVLDGPGYSIGFGLNSGDPIETLMLNVRGTDDALAPIETLCRHTGWRALDVGNGHFLDFSADPADGLRHWRAYREHVLVSKTKLNGTPDKPQEL